jgi:hypothetical protein
MALYVNQNHESGTMYSDIYTETRENVLKTLQVSYIIIKLANFYQNE